jgi:hypothetical protein
MVRTWLQRPMFTLLQLIRVRNCYIPYKMPYTAFQSLYSEGKIRISSEMLALFSYQSLHRAWATSKSSHLLHLHSFTTIRIYEVYTMTPMERFKMKKLNSRRVFQHCGNVKRNRKRLNYSIRVGESVLEFGTFVILKFLFLSYVSGTFQCFISRVHD